MSLPDDLFVPDDPGLYGPDPLKGPPRSPPLRQVLGLSAKQLAFVVAASVLLFAFLGGPFWSAGRAAFPLRLFASYLIIPALVVPLLWWNDSISYRTIFAASVAAAAIKFAVTVVIDVAHGLMRNWPP